jgi:hypothetical protein
MEKTTRARRTEKGNYEANLRCVVARTVVPKRPPEGRLRFLERGVACAAASVEGIGYSCIVLGGGMDYKKETFSRILSDAVLKEHGFSSLPTSSISEHCPPCVIGEWRAGI